ncbi:MAG: carboxypeptidase regulatory-like domain-containing protein, partial [Thermoplasmata archaeon]|nr:carboxypeptidase regulatory-like domain-containing protein [Thermoplasmata archaeon]
PTDFKFLAVMMYADPDVIDDKDASGISGMTTVEVLVFDPDNEPVSNASIVIQVDPKEPEISPAVVETDSEGKAMFTFKAADIDGDKEYTVSVIAFRSGYKNGTQSIPIVVMDNYNIDNPVENCCPDFTGIILFIIIFAAIPTIIILAIVFLIKKLKINPRK